MTSLIKNENRRLGMVYTICIGSNERRKDNLALARKRLSELFRISVFCRDRYSTAFLPPASIICQPGGAFHVRLRCPRNYTLFEEYRTGSRKNFRRKKQEIVRLDIDLLSCDNRVYKPEDLKRDYIVRGLEELDEKI